MLSLQRFDPKSERGRFRNDARSGVRLGRIRQLEPKVEMTREADALCERVEEAFAGITLGKGVGLSQGRVLDDYGTEQELLAAREQDEKEHWERIPSEALCAYSSSLSFFDAEGLRFHLPAFLVAELKGELI